MTKSARIFRSACANEQAKTNLEETVVEGVDEETYRLHTNIDALEDRVPVWGVPRATSSWENLSRGDYVLFYTGEDDSGTRKYGYGGRVLAKEKNPDLRRELWDVYTRVSGSGESDDPWDYVIYFDESFPLDIKSADLHAYDSVSKDWIQKSFLSFGDNQATHEKIRDEYGSIDEYISVHRNDRTRAVPDISEYWEMVQTKRELAEAFIDNSTKEAFERLVDTDHFWGTWGLHQETWFDTLVFDEKTPEEIADGFENAMESGSIELVLQLDGFACPIASEILRALEPHEFPILNSRSVKGMEALGYDTPADPSTASASQYDEFTDDVWEAIETNDFRTILESVRDDSIPGWATDLEIVDAVFNAHSEEDIEFNLEDYFDSQRTSTTDPAPYYWVKQTRSPEEIEGEYLSAPNDENPGHDLGKLEVGDIVFNYTDGQVIGYSEVTEPASLTEVGGEKQCRVEVSLNRFDDPLSFAEVFEHLAKDSVQPEKHSPVHDEGVNQGYLFNLTKEGGEYLLKQAGNRREEVHPILEHYRQRSDISVWHFCVTASEWLTVLRRSSMHLWDTDDDRDEYRNKWQETTGGDIVLFHVMQDEVRVGDNIEVPNNGIFGAGIVGEKSKKSELWWRNEDDGLVYPYIIKFAEFYATSNLDKIELETPVFVLDDDTIVAEFEPLTTNLMDWKDVITIAEETTGRGIPPGTGSYKNLSKTHDAIEQFVPLLLRRLGPRLTKVTPPDDLPSMLPPVGEVPDRSEELADQLQRIGQVVLYGPPGTSKTFTATRFARWWIREQTERPVETRFRTVTFHPSFAYEDFMEGLMADATDGGQVQYDYEDGIFKEIVQEARDAYLNATDLDDAPRYVLLIDEINRGNLSQIFGEAITQLEMDKRLGQEEEVSIQWAHRGDEVAIPPNLYIIGTMNTADRSIALVDAALRRRFTFHSFPPDYNLFHEEYPFNGQDEIKELANAVVDEGREAIDESKQAYLSLLALSIQALKAINENILAGSDLNKGKRIGHSYLLNIDSEDDLVAAWRYEILPLLEEYYFGDFNRLRREVFEVDVEGGSRTTVDTRLFDHQQHDIRDFDADDLEAALGQFVEDHQFESQ